MTLLHRARWDLGESVEWLNLSESISLYVRESRIPSRIFRTEDCRDLTKLVVGEMEKQLSNSGAELIFPLNFSEIIDRELVNWVIWHPDKLSLTIEENNQRLAVSGGYADWTERPWIDWMSDPANASRWIGSELVRLAETLTANNGFIQNHTYSAMFWKEPEVPYEWNADIQRVQIGNKTARLSRFKDRRRGNLVMI